MDHAIGILGHGLNEADNLNAKDKQHFKNKWCVLVFKNKLLIKNWNYSLFLKLYINNFCRQIFTYYLSSLSNGCYQRIFKKNDSESKYDQIVYTIQRYYYVKQIAMKLCQHNTSFPSLNIFNGKIPPYGSKGVIRHYLHRDDKKLGQVIVTVKIVFYSFQARQKNGVFPGIQKL